MFTSMSRARTVNIRIALATTKKGDLSMAEYVAKMRSLADEIVSAGKAIDDDELVSYVLAGLDFDYNPIVSALVARTEPISVWIFSSLIAAPRLIPPTGGAAHCEAREAEGACVGRSFSWAWPKQWATLSETRHTKIISTMGLTIDPGVRFAR